MDMKNVFTDDMRVISDEGYQMGLDHPATIKIDGI